MSNHAYLVAKNSAVASFEVGQADEEVSTSADFVPVAWFAMFDKNNIVVTEPPDSDPETHWRCLSLITSKKDALSSLAAKKTALLTVFPTEFGPYVQALEEALEKSQGTHFQLVLSDLDDHFAENNRAVLEGFLDTISSKELAAWRELVSYVGCTLGDSLNDLEFDTGIVVNSLVGWVAGQPAPDACRVSAPKRTRKPWWKLW